MSFAGLFMLIFAQGITGLLTSEPDVRYWGTRCPQIMGLGVPLDAVGMVMVQSLNGAGDTTPPAVLTLICFWMLQITLAYLLATRTALEPNGALIAIVIPETLLTVRSVIVFRRASGKYRAA